MKILYKLSNEYNPAGVYILKLDRILFWVALHWWGWNLAWWVYSSILYFTPISATCRPCRAKSLKVALWVTEVPAYTPRAFCQ